MIESANKRQERYLKDLQWHPQEPVTITMVNTVITRIEDCIEEGHPNTARDLEEALYTELLRAIAEDRCENPRQAAHYVMFIQKLDFSRSKE